LTVVASIASSANEAQQALPSVLVGPIWFFSEVNHQRLLASSACAVVDEAVDSKLIKEANFIVANSCMRLIN
jgi:hypothetical protein